MTDILVVDDHLLLRVLLDDEPSYLRPAGAAIVTTGLWYHRLCRALSDQTVIGSISRRLGQVEDEVGASVIKALVALPDSIELLSLRTLGWRMAELVPGGARLNLLSLEALAAADHLGAAICLADNDVNEPLIAASEGYGIRIRSIPG